MRVAVIADLPIELYRFGSVLLDTVSIEIGDAEVYASCCDIVFAGSPIKQHGLFPILLNAVTFRVV